jgi:hypothetical protein
MILLVFLSRITPCSQFRFRIIFWNYESFGCFWWDSLDGIGPSQGLYLHRIAQNRETRTYVHVSSGIRTHDPSVRAAQDLTYLRSCCRWDDCDNQFQGDEWRTWEIRTQFCSENLRDRKRLRNLDNDSKILIIQHDYVDWIELAADRFRWWPVINTVPKLVNVKGKVKIVLVPFLTERHAMKAYCGSGGIAPRILDLDTRWRWVVSFTPWPFYPQGEGTHWIGDCLDPRAGLDVVVRKKVPSHCQHSNPRSFSP